MTRVVCRQLAPAVGELDANVEMSVAAVRDAVAEGGQIIVLPELMTSGYVFASPEEARSLAITPEHQVFSAWADLARASGAVVVSGFAELGDGGALYNSAAVVDGTGVLAVYRKAHLWDREKLFFAAGSEPPPVVETRFGRLGVLICFDLEFPEMARSLTVRGADLLTVPTNWPLMERPPGERPAEVTIAMATARVNRVGIACCDRAGTERGQEWTNGTAVIDEQGWVAALPDDSGAAAAEIDLLRARDKRLTELSDILADRRPELYATVTDPRV